MKKLILTSFLIILAMNILTFVGCDSDSGSDSKKGSLVGTWEAVLQEVDLSAINFGKLKIPPTSDQFVNFIIDIKEDGTFSYDTWTGTDAEAEHSLGTGTWATDGSNFSMDFDDEESDDIDGTYELKGNTLKINSTLSMDFLGTGDPITAPTTMTLERVNITI